PSCRKKNSLTRPNLTATRSHGRRGPRKSRRPRLFLGNP
uniref:Uncharacterized protein n=1 Tax=Aegilops tauschii subsp. strangulata TaxID=200361 RepID=A0A452YRH5_AEGTS